MLLVALLSAVGLAATSADNTAGPIDWQVYGRRLGAQLTTADVLRFVNRSSRKAVGYGERQYGINLVWVSQFKRTASFVDFSGTRTLRYRWPLALKIAGGGFLTYHERDYGINLGWTSRPAYEWEIHGSLKAVGSIVRSGDRVAVYNSHINRYIVYGKRDYGIDLVWLGGVGLRTPAPTLTLRPKCAAIRQPFSVNVSGRGFPANSRLHVEFWWRPGDPNFGVVASTFRTTDAAGAFDVQGLSIIQPLDPGVYEVTATPEGTTEPVTTAPFRVPC